MSMRVLTSGVDSLYFSVRAALRAEAWEPLKRAKDRAEHERESAPLDFPLTGQATLANWRWRSPSYSWSRLVRRP